MPILKGMAKETPKNLNELVDQLVTLERRNKELQRKVDALTEVNTEARKRAVLLHSKATKQSTFTNYEVKKYAKSLMDMLSQIPLKR